MAAMGTTSRGRMMLRYLTMAPRLFTVNPIINNTAKEKNRQKNIKAALFFVLTLQTRKTRNINNMQLISSDAASDNKCRTSVG